MASPHSKASADEAWGEGEDASLLATASWNPDKFRSWRSRVARRWTSAWDWAPIICSGLANIVLAAIIGYLSSTRLLPMDCPCTREPYSPAESAVEYIPVNFIRAFGSGKHVSPYQGWPNDEQDRLWEEMYNKGASIRINEAESKHINNKTERIPLPGYENDYLVGIDVFHQLHCLNMVRMAFYPGRYNMSFKRPDNTVDYTSWMHLDHCIESLRMSITCSADINPFTYHFVEDRQIIEPDIGSFHVCRNFSKIQEWTFPRYVDVENRQSRVLPDGRIADYSKFRPAPEQPGGSGGAPSWWRYNPDDL